MNLKLIEGWQNAWKYWSVWAMVILGMLPEIMAVLVQYGLVPAAESNDATSKLMKLVMVAGILLRMVSQKKAELDATAPKTDADSGSGK